MPKAKKFGVFGGVFTPSLLTILGVIMYLRLSWVVGNAGFIGSLAIILVAHVISISTGLSVSSVATDRKVKAGGLYYMLSRSLGLPIGGAIGIALFAATALSISMYVVGFAESFNETIQVITPGMDEAEKLFTLRITGSITLFIITGIALISTSLAIQTQYYILGAIILSLISIFAGGFFIPEDIALTGSLNLFAQEGSASYEEVFGIFFPAVTGFTAGVAMSGDLKDPKKAIPIGTMAAIAVGLVVYIALATFLSLSISTEALKATEVNLFSKITLMAAFDMGTPFLLAGIWGATLSSALGGILGGPRILQAMSADQVTPKIFAKGVGATNEPRNALIFTFVIAELGVLIGKLDLIAPIVSMFYLTAYGFINLTSALESWTGSDFRPQFRIPKAVSIIGAIATFTVMSQIGLFAMIMAFLIIGAIFFYLTKKQINLGFSDIWQGVWAELVRIGLFRLDRKSTANDKKNWRPNILLFSGDKTKRSYLVEFGQGLVGRLGVVSSFELFEKSEKATLLPKAEQSEQAEQAVPGMFFRRYQCENIYDDIGVIAETFGFSGMEPNTVLMGWARYSKSPQEFTSLIKRFQKLDYNALIMDYDQQRGFGTHDLIDIWWNGESNHLGFALTMVRFLTAAEEWRKAKVRLFIMLDKNRVNSMEVYQQMEEVLEELRIYASVKIVDNQQGNKPLYDAIRVESGRADLIFIELPKIDNQEDRFFEETDALCKDIGTVVLYQGSSQFPPINLGLSDIKVTDSIDASALESNGSRQPSIDPSSLVLPQHAPLATNMRQLHHSLSHIVEQNHTEAITPIFQEQAILLASIQQICLGTLEKWQEERYPDPAKATHLLKKNIEQIQALLTNYSNSKLKVQSDQLYKNQQEALRQIRQTLRHLPRRIAQEFNKEQLANLSETQRENFSLWRRKWSKIIHQPTRYIHYVRLQAEIQLLTQGVESLHSWRANFLKDTLEWGQQLHLIEQYIIRVLQESLTEENAGDSEALSNAAETIRTAIHPMKEWSSQKAIENKAFWQSLINRFIQQLSFDLDGLKRPKAGAWKIRSMVGAEEREAFWSLPATWLDNKRLLINRLLIDADFSKVELGNQRHIAESKVAIDSALQDYALLDLKRLSLEFENYLENPTQGLPEVVPPRTEWYFQHQQIINELISHLNEQLSLLPDELSLATENAMLGEIEELDRNDSGDIPSVVLSPQAVSGYLLQTSFVEPLIEEANAISSLIDDIVITLQSSARVIGISLKNTEESELKNSESTQESFKALIQEEHERISELRNRLMTHNSSILLSIDKLYGDANEQLNAFGVVKSASKLDNFLRTKSREEVLNRFAQSWQHIQSFAYERLTDWRYSRWQGLRNSQIKAVKDTSPKYADLLSLKPFVNGLTPNREVELQLPFYYRQLFSSDQISSIELWVGREEALAKAETAIEGHRFGQRNGGLLLTGGYLSGKTFLLEKISEQFLRNRRVIEVKPPEAGSSSLKDFRAAINKVIGGYDYRLDTIMERILPDDSVVIIHDLELWWEKRAEGYQVLERLEELIANHGNRILFIATVNHHTLGFWQRTGRLESSFGELIHCSPMSAKELQKLITARHRSTHLRYQLNGTHEDLLSNWNEAGLFTSLYEHSQGNIGVALQTWLSNIEEVSKHLLTIRQATKPDTSILKSLDPTWVITLLQFVLHKQLGVGRLSTVLQIDQYLTTKRLRALQRSGLVTEQNGIWQIDRFILPYLVRFLEEEGIL